ncbi:Vps62-related protein [Streptomyces neyagawaensis]|uniref:Vps62-related protein n=1 Tax=Streptomyces neyagawaensis TaxID=42238 RepID=A0ABV3ASZ3_9ACTN
MRHRSVSVRRWGAGLIATASALVLLPALASPPAVAAERTRSAATASVSSADEELARRYAPRIWLQSAEDYFPSSVEWSLENTHIETHGDDQFYVTNEPLGCDSCTNPGFLSGQRPDHDDVPAYAEVVHRTENGRATNITDIIYWTFYPYNNGKRVCIGWQSPFGCVGGYSTFGNHVGDWEHVTIRFVGDKPYQISLSQHDGGQALVYGAEGILDGDQPVVYAAQGSHGLYPDAGRHTYRHLPNGDTLDDDTDAGTLWDTRKGLQVFSWQDKYSGDLEWLNFTGRWGNWKSGCGISEPITGECVLNDGPKGPSMKEVFKPHMQALDGAPGLFGGAIADMVIDGDRTGVLTTDGTAYVREGDAYANWMYQADGVSSLALSGNRIGIVQGDVASVKEGGLDAGWVRQSEGVSSLALSGNRVGVIRKGVAEVKEGDLNAGWVTQAEGVSSLVLSGNRVGVIHKGVAEVKEGDLKAEWGLQEKNAASLSLSGDRVGVLTTDRTALVKAGDLHADWVNEFGGVTGLTLSDTRVGVLVKGGKALVKEGDLSAEWVDEADAVTSLVLSGDRIGILTTDGTTEGTAYVKQGGLHAKWGLQNFTFRDKGDKGHKGING